MLVAARDQRRSGPHGSAGVRGDHLPGCLWRLLFGRRCVEEPSPAAALPPRRQGQPAGRLPADQRTTGRRRGPQRGRPLGGRPDRRGCEQERRSGPGGARQPPRPGRSAARWLHRPPSRRSSHRSARPPAPAPRPHPHLGPRPRNGPLGRHRSSTGHRGLLLRTPQPLAAPDQRAHQRAAATLAAQRHPPRSQPTAAVSHRGQPQHDAPKTPQPGISRRHLHSTCPAGPSPATTSPVPERLRCAASRAAGRGRCG